MQPGSDIAPQDPATNPEQEAWRRPTTVEARLEHQASQLTEILNTFHELRLYVEQHATHTVPPDPGPTTVQPADAAQTPAHSDPLSAQSFTRGGIACGQRPLTPSTGAAPLVSPPTHSAIPIPMAESPVSAPMRSSARSSSWSSAPETRKRKAATTFETSGYHQGSRSVDEYIDKFQDLAEEAQFPDGAQLVFRFRHGLDPRIEAKVANMVDGCPSDERIQEWIDAARLVDYNTRANQDFRSAVTKTRTAPAPVVWNPGTPALRALPAPPPRPVAAAPPALTAPAQSLPFSRRSDGH
ncbi:hypothetical protein LshimejAT787_4500020 [Lyophyllum shimeji]|uniref:Retrotransposon gag domain-containing protein n=1 Tax=Lyophyllum shimeji TaxID=47721 RepID=A0A9P3Q2F6_LYOSH|nr:hypothetical protein LshimejAT787_4500020 [Lyophyllum shimeji]